jgi:hypothetical protein
MLHNKKQRRSTWTTQVIKERWMVLELERVNASEEPEEGHKYNCA